MFSEEVVLTVVNIIGLAVLFWIAKYDMSLPLLKKRCKYCGYKGRNWTIVAIGHDNFTWEHNCEEEA